MADKPITIQDVTDYLGIDETDAKIERNIVRAIDAADAFLKGAIADNYPVGDPRVKEIALCVVADIYDERGLISSVSGNVRRLVNDFSWQLKLELRRATDGENV